VAHLVGAAANLPPAVSGLERWLGGGASLLALAFILEFAASDATLKFGAYLALLASLALLAGVILNQRPDLAARVVEATPPGVFDALEGGRPAGAPGAAGANPGAGRAYPGSGRTDTRSGRADTHSHTGPDPGAHARADPGSARADARAGVRRPGGGLVSRPAGPEAASLLGRVALDRADRGLTAEHR
jgi:hypothetical protein